MKIQPLEWAAFIAKVDAGELEAWAAALNLDPYPDLGVSLALGAGPADGPQQLASTGTPRSTRSSTGSVPRSTARMRRAFSRRSSASSTRTSPCRS